MNVRIPVDCSKCDNGKCKLRNKCMRWLAVPHDRQTYAHFEQPGCEHFWPMEEEIDGTHAGHATHEDR
jgi:hypothetical protein